MTPTRSVVERLREARARIEDPANWCQGAFARDRSGDPVGSKSPVACQWCAEGALTVAGGGFDAEVYLLRALPLRVNDVGGYNDHRTHATVLRLFDRAIALAEGANPS